ncbi:MAG TPA: methyltransferase domain-containing protein [Solirubrobacterales bacterium]|nr:methyltransferase domain-containing protein [Solirubrobacterales bacterium]
MSSPKSSPDRKTVLIGRTISRIVAHTPWLWPVVSRPVMRFFDAAAKGWDSNTRAGQPEHLAPLAAAVLKVTGTPERVLDIGCGTGAATLFLSREFPQARVRGVDLSPRMIAEANAKIGLDPEARVAFREGDASSLPYPDQNFDLVAQTNMPIFFAEIDRVLRPGGTVIIASSLGQSTPFSTPDGVTRRKFAKLGISEVETGEAADGTYFVGRKEESFA